MPNHSLRKYIPKKPSAYLLLAVLILAALGPVLIYRIPYLISSPDMYYVKAKVMQVSQGELFADPITGYDTFHPPFYHACLSLITGAGAPIDTVLVIVTILNVILIFLLTFWVVKTAFDSQTALLTCAMLIFIFDYMGSKYLLLASSFNFSIPFYLAGLLYYLRSRETSRYAALSGLFWGLAFLISSIYLFLITLTFLYELLFVRKYRRCSILILAFAVTIVPFYFQMYTVYSQHLGDTTTFALWRGIPDLDWGKNLLIEFLSPSRHKILSLPSIIHGIILLTALAIILKTRKVHWIIPTAAAAYLLTLYHFSGQYAIRIQLFLSVFIVATVVYNLRKWGGVKIAWIFPIVLLWAGSTYQHYGETLNYYNIWLENRPDYFQAGHLLWHNLDKHVPKNSYIFVTKDTYFRFIMPYYPVHSLGAYRTLDYYQLSERVTGMLERDYETALQSSDRDTIEIIADRYGIETAIAGGIDEDLPLFQTLAQYWKPVYRDGFFRIFKRY